MCAGHGRFLIPPPPRCQPQWTAKAMMVTTLPILTHFRPFFSYSLFSFFSAKKKLHVAADFH